MVFGRELNTPLSVILLNERGLPGPEMNAPYGTEAYTLYKTFKQIVHRVRRVAKQDFLYADNAWKGTEGTFLEEGDLCFTYVNCPEHKFSYRWEGPYTVKRVINVYLYVINFGGSERVISVTKLKKFKPRDGPGHQTNLDYPTISKDSLESNLDGIFIYEKDNSCHGNRHL